MINRFAKKTLASFFLPIIVLSSSGCNFSSATSPDNVSAQSQINGNTQLVDALFERFSEETPGIAVAASRNGEILFQKGYGSANLEYDIPITPDTVFNVGSVSKQFTAFSIFLLAEQGHLSLDDDIRKYIPEIPDFGTPITLRHLSTHTSGLRDQWALLTLAGWRMDDVITDEQILNLLSRQTELNFTPGEKYLYSNSGYMLLAEVVARVSGKSFRDFAREEIFTPLGMQDTQVYENYTRIVPGRAYSYGRSENGYGKRNLNASVVGPTSVLSSAKDLTKWAHNFDKPIVGTPEMIKRFNEPAILNSGEKAILTVNAGGNVYVASGQFISNFRGTPLYNHTGSTGGFESYLARFPEKGFAVAALSNHEHYNIFKNGLAVADVFLSSEIEPPPEPKSPAAAITATPDAVPVFNDVSDVLGNYANKSLGTSYAVIKVDAGIALNHIRHGTIPLKQSGEDQFSGQLVFPIDIKFRRNQAGEITAFDISNFGAKNVIFTQERQR